MARTDLIGRLRIACLVRAPALVQDLASCVARVPAEFVFKDPGELPLVGSGTLAPVHTEPQIDVVLLDISGCQTVVGGLTRSVKNWMPNAMLVALDTEACADRILEAMRAGAEEFLFPPIYDSLLAALARCTERTAVAATPRSGLLIAVLAAKGGCGATMIACHLAADLTRHAEISGLLADFDFTGGGIRFLMKSKCTYSVADAFASVHRLDASLWAGLVSNGVPRLDVIAGPPRVCAAPAPTQEQILGVLAYIRSSYPWAVLDLGCVLNRCSQPTLLAADRSYLVSSLEITALHQARMLAARLAADGYDTSRIELICSPTPAKPLLNAGEIEQLIGLRVCAMLPDERALWDECVEKGALLPDDCNFRRKLRPLASSIAGAPGPQDQQSCYSPRAMQRWHDRREASGDPVPSHSRGRQ